MDKSGIGARVTALMPDTDPALPIVTSILRVVPASSWSFARVKPTGRLTSLLSSGVAQDPVEALAALTDEFARQRAKVKAGPRIAASFDGLRDDESAISMLFADARRDFGILTLRRTAEEGWFSTSEIGILTFALDSASGRLSALRMNLAPRSGRGRSADLPEDLPMPDADAAFYVLDAALEIVLAWSCEEEERIRGTGLRTRDVNRLPAILEESVRALTSEWKDDTASRKRGVARPVPFLTVRVQPLSGSAGSFIGVRIERIESLNSLADAAMRFGLSPRELEVLALLFEGAHLDDISRALHITSSTVQDHIRSMVGKTASRNRSELIARVLGWEYEPASTV